MHVFNELHITAQSGSVLLVVICYSPPPVGDGMCVSMYVCNNNIIS